MWDYATSIVFYALFIWMLYALGNVIIKTERDQTVKCVAGYLAYSFCVALIGIFVQLLNIKWKLFATFMLILLAGIIIVIIITKRNRGALFTCSLQEYISNNWFIYFLTAILCFMMLFYFRSFWYGNHLDDGYYVTKVATVAYDGGNYRGNFAVGLGNGLDFSYLLNTWELEASFFVNILRITPTVFLRFFQSGFNYFVFFNCALAFGKQILAGIKKKTNNRLSQYVLGGFLVFFVYYVFMQHTQIFFLRDAFHLNTGMYYGAAIAKSTIIMCMLLFFLSEEAINLKMMILVAGISVVMISKSSIVLPMLVVIIIASSITWLVQSEDKKSKIAAVALVILVVLVSIILPGSAGAQHEVYTYVKCMVKSPVMWICTLIYFRSFWLKEKVVKRLNCIMFISCVMIVVPEINDLFETFSVYSFVAARAWSMWVYTFVIMCGFYFYILLNQKITKGGIKAVYAVLTGGMVILLVYGFKTDGKELFVTDQMPATTNLSQDIQILLHNRKFLPNATIELGEELETVSEETGEQLYVLSPQWVGVNDAAHSLSIQLRTVAPSVISVSASDRYKVDEKCELYGYDQSKYDEFTYDPNDQTLDALKVQIEKYNINCIVAQNEKCGEYLKTIGFQKESVIGGGTYFVWFKLAE